MKVLKSYTTNIKEKIFYTIDILEHKGSPKYVVFYKVSFNAEGFPTSQKILDLEIKGKTKKDTLDLVHEMINSIKLVKEHKLD